MMSKKMTVEKNKAAEYPGSHACCFFLGFYYTTQRLKKCIQFCCPNEEAALGIIVVSLPSTTYLCGTFLTL